MTIVHANDPTTKFLSQLYEMREDVSMFVTETSTNSDVIRALRGDDHIMMLGHGNPYGLFSLPDKNGKYERFLITDRHVQFLRGKTCVGIWCHADQFARSYGLHGLFSGMIISELQEALDYQVRATKEEIDGEMVKFAHRLRYSMDRFDLSEIPERMLEMDDVRSELTSFNYSHLYYFE